MAFTHNFFKQLMWRSSKAHVWDELQLPPQEECVSWLSFSPIEEHFYQRQHETCVDDAREVVESFKDDIRKKRTTGKYFSFVLSYIETCEALGCEYSLVHETSFKESDSNKFSVQIPCHLMVQLNVILPVWRLPSCLTHS